MPLEEEVRAYACAVVPACTPDSVLSVTRLEEGDRHAVYRLAYLAGDSDRHDVIVRVSTRSSADACADARREARVISLAEGVAAPVLYDVRCTSQWFDSPVMCMQFVVGRQSGLAAAPDDDVASFGSLLARVHRLPIDHLAGFGSPSATIAAYLDERQVSIMAGVEPARALLPPTIRRRVDDAASAVKRAVKAARHAPSFQGDDHLVLLHGDPGAGNIIWTPTPVLIDWEYARFGDPADEIAYIFGQHPLTTAQRHAFWRGYSIDLDPQQVERIADRASTWEPLTLLGSTLWWLERWAHRTHADSTGVADPTTPKAAGYYQHGATRRLDRLYDVLDAEVAPPEDSE